MEGRGRACPCMEGWKDGKMAGWGLISLSVLLLLALPFGAVAAEWQFAPRQRLFRPLLADPGEARFGIFKYLDDNRLEGIIGGSWEAFNVADARGAQIRFGIHSAVFTLLRQNGSTFPLDTTDFLIATHTDLQRGRFTGRFEFGHISAHLADGFDDPDRKSITYSREFFTGYGSYDWPSFRLYAGVRLSNHAIPDIRRWRVQFGGEWTRGRSPGVYLAYDVRIFNDAGTVVNQTGQGGVLFHNAGRAGLRLALIGHTGRSEHGQFHDLTDRYAGLGVFFDL